MKEFVLKLIVGIISQPIFWIFLILVLLCFIFYKKFRGFMGEFWVKTELNKLPKDSYIILNDIMIKSSTGTHQIDHIVISKFGIFVIETKNYYGLIIGDEYKSKWIQYIGKNKYYFNNPIHQNYGHIKGLAETLHLDENNFISIICISNQAKVKVTAKNVTQLDFLNNLIQSYKKEILDINLNEIENKIKLMNISDKTIRRNHVKNIKNTIRKNMEKEQEMICPKCGRRLIERTGKYGKFIGCSNYPKCKYTTDIKK